MNKIKKKRKSVSRRDNPVGRRPLFFNGLRELRARAVGQTRLAFCYFFVTAADGCLVRRALAGRNLFVGLARLFIFLMSIDGIIELNVWMGGDVCSLASVNLVVCECYKNIARRREKCFDNKYSFCLVNRNRYV